MLEVTTQQIVFQLKNNEYAPYILKLRNTTSNYLGYKPEYFQVKQSRGIINPQSQEQAEFNLTERAKNLDPKYLVNQKFQIYVINMSERKSTLEIDQLFQTQPNQNIRLFTAIIKEEQGRQVQIQADPLSSSVTSSVIRNSGSRIITDSQIKSSNNQIDQIQRLRELEKQLNQEKCIREHLFNNIEINKINKNSKSLQYLLVIFFGLILSIVYKLNQ